MCVCDEEKELPSPPPPLELFVLGVLCILQDVDAFKSEYRPNGRSRMNGKRGNR